MLDIFAKEGIPTSDNERRPFRAWVFVEPHCRYGINPLFVRHKFYIDTQVREKENLHWTYLKSEQFFANASVVFTSQFGTEPSYKIEFSLNESWLLLPNISKSIKSHHKKPELEAAKLVYDKQFYKHHYAVKIFSEKKETHAKKIHKGEI